VLEAPGAMVLVDCGGSPVGRLRQAGLDPLGLTHVVVTHIHPDHAYGLPSLLQNLRLLRRTAPLPVVCRPEHVEPLRQILTLFGVIDRPGAVAVSLTGIDLAPGARAFAAGALALHTTSNAHGRMPNFALRADVAGEGAVAYSSDTEPSDAVVALARGAHTLVHEATFPHRDRGRFGAHSTAREAGEVAARADVRRLILTHVDADYHDELDALAEAAATAFGGPVDVARELGAYPWPPAS
jgi:ribonuclease Z